MSIDRIKNTSLWNVSLAEVKDDKYSEQRDDLRSSFLKFRNNASMLVSQISGVLPGLTQHDITHLDALWETASIICGDDYPLSPLEAFVLGGSILLHDSALCFEAYENGVEGVRETVTWKDHYASLKDQCSNEKEEEDQSSADFAALRSLHAQQAEELGEMGWRDPDTNQELFLIENPTLRKHLGKLIGQIAASHHWNIDDVISRLPNQVNTLSSYPREWRIDPVKLACILRCADAAHIDNERAPDFLHALIKRRGISYVHWQAQNKLASVDIDQSDSTGSTLLFTSTRNFLESESESWWVAYDAICMIDKEIRDSNALLESRSIPLKQFQVKRVRGVESPELMSNYLQTEGWNPCMAEIHVGNIEGLVDSLGGEKLYGAGCDKLEVILRELIQNSRDSIHARRISDEDFSGRITVRIRNVSGDYWLFVEDDGVGMSKRVLTGPLLDFGTSFWTSSLVQSEFPGLRSSRFKSVGKFGIGFYSVFMVSDEVRVSSRPWKGGEADVWQVYFKNGLSLRPILKNSVPLDLPSKASTQISVRLKKGTFDGDKITIKRNLMNSKNLEVSIDEYISAICTGLDVSVFFSHDDSEGIEVHPEAINDNNKLNWLHSIAFSKHQNEEVSNYIENNHSRLRPIIDNGRCCGVAALSTYFNNDQNFLNMNTVGGLSSGIHTRDGSNFIGYIDYLPQSARRDGQVYSASKEAIETWAKEQIGLIDYIKLNPYERYALASSLCHFGVDPMQVASIATITDNKVSFLSFSDIAELSLRKGIAIFKSPMMDHMETHHTIDGINDYALIKPISNGKFLSLSENDGIPENNFSIYDCLYRSIIAQGNKPEIQIMRSSVKSAFGMMDTIIVKSKKE